MGNRFKVPTAEEGAKAERLYVLNWLRQQRDQYDRQAKTARQEWFDLSVACGDVARDAIETLEQKWGE